tara:strand:+ start:214 stop:441 length:228 start_codon:yes stop_codon:yes gene_type:complete
VPEEIASPRLKTPDNETDSSAKEQVAAKVNLIRESPQRATSPRHTEVRGHRAVQKKDRAQTAKGLLPNDNVDAYA